MNNKYILESLFNIIYLLFTLLDCKLLYLIIYIDNSELKLCNAFKYISNAILLYSI